MRPNLDVHGSLMDVFQTLSEGNPGAITALVSMARLNGQDTFATLMDLLDVDDMNLRGPQIWLAFKDVCGEDPKAFKDAINARDKKLVDVVNEMMGRGGEVPLYKKAVTHGGSEPPYRQPC